MSFWRAVFPDLTFTVEDVLAEGDRVAARHIWRGTHKGDYPVPALGRTVHPTGKQIVGHCIAIFRIVDGKIVEKWETADFLTMLQQMDAFPVAG